MCSVVVTVAISFTQRFAIQGRMRRIDQQLSLAVLMSVLRSMCFDTCFDTHKHTKHITYILDGWNVTEVCWFVCVVWTILTYDGSIFDFFGQIKSGAATFCLHMNILDIDWFQAIGLISYGELFHRFLLIYSSKETIFIPPF